MSDWPTCVKCKEAEVTEHPDYQPLGLCFACGRKDAREKEEKAKISYKIGQEERRIEGDEKTLKEVNAKAPQIRKAIRKDDYKFIPPHMRWCALNPALTVHEEDMTNSDRRKERAYIRGEGEAGPLAANLYAMLKGNEKALEAFFNKITHLFEVYDKKRESREKTEDSRQVENIWKHIKSSMVSGVVANARKTGKLPERVDNKK